MKTTLVFHKLNNKTHLPPWASSLLFPSKTLISSNPSSSSFSCSIPNHYLYNGDISLLISICGRNQLYHLGTSLHASIVKSFNLFQLDDDHENLRISIVVWNSLLSFYCKCGELRHATKLFDRMPARDTISWNSVISGWLTNGDFEGGFGVFKRMRELGIEKFDQATLTSVLSKFDGLEFRCMSRMMHGLAFVSGFVQEITVGNALVTSYFKCGCFSSGIHVFDEMYDKNVVTWTAVISGLVQNQFYEEGLTLFLKMRRGLVSPNNVTYLSSLAACAGLQALSEGSQIHGIVCKLGIQSELCIESALMDLYSKCGNMESAWKVFESAEKLDMISVTVMLVGFAQNGYEEEAIQFFLNMVKGGYEIDPNMVSSILGVFGIDTSLALGQQIHSLIIKRRFELNPFVSNGLINMYSKCGGLEDSTKVFNQMPLRNSVSWNSMIAAFARHGNALQALQLYEDMILDGAEPTDITFLSLIHACSHVGLVEKGMQYLDSMTKIHGICPRMEHYACIVDMLGRAGLINEAKSFIEKMPEKPNALVWQALLGACGIYNDSEMGKYAAEQLYYAAPENPMSYVLLANIYSSEGRWKDRARTIKKMKEMGVSKETGISWIEIDKRVHSFVVEDRKHPQAEMMYGVLAELFKAMIDEGYVPDKRFILYQLDREEPDGDTATEI